MSLQRLYREQFRRVFAYILLRVGGNREVAEDLTADVFLQAVRHMDTLDEADHPTAWLFAVARNRLKNHYRDTRPNASFEDVSEPFAPQDDTDVMDVDRVRRALQDLPEQDRTILEYKYVYGFRFTEIARLLSKSTAAVRVQAHRARAVLKRNLSHL